MGIRGFIERGMSAVLIGTLLAGCGTGSVPPANPDGSGGQTPASAAPRGGEVPVQPDPTATSIISPTETAAQYATETPSPLKPGRGGPETPAETAFKNSERGQALTKWYSDWLGYWSTAKETDRYFYPESLDSDTARVYLKPMLDPNDPTKGTLVFESIDYPGVVIVPPAYATKDLLPPPDYLPNHDIAPGTGIVEITTAWADGSATIYTVDQFIRVNKEGQQIGVIDENLVWQEVETIESITAAMTSFPSKELEIPNNCYEVASPIDNPEQYSKDMDKYLAAFYKLMENYTGPFIDTSQNLFLFDDWMKLDTGIKMAPAGCVRFKDGDKDFAQFSLVGKDDEGFFPINFIVNSRMLNPWGDVMRITPDEVLPLIPGEISGKLSSVMGSLDTITTNSFWAELGNDFINRYYKVPQNVGLRQNLSDWMFTKKFDRSTGSKKAFVLLNWQAPGH